MSLDGRLNRIEAYFGTEPGSVDAIWFYFGYGPVGPHTGNGPTVFRWFIPEIPGWLAPGLMILLKPGESEVERARWRNRSRSHGAEDDEDDDAELSPEAEAETLRLLQTESGLSSRQRAIVRRAKYVAILTAHKPTLGPGCEMTDEHYRDTTGFLPDDSQSD
jgi:hypothetical protein